MSRLNIGIDIASSANSVLYGSTAPLVAGGYIPDLAADFLNEYYRTETGNKTFLKTIEHSRNGNATMTDSSGNIVWAPHNLLTYSEDFSNAAWTKTDTTVTANAAVAPDGTTTADKITVNSASQSFVRDFIPISATKHIFGIFAKAGTTNTIQAYIIQQGVASGTADIDLSDGTVSNVSGAWTEGVTATPVGDGWYYIQGGRTFTASASNHGAGVSATGQNGLDFYIWGAHLYRSDLGGMADVPADDRVIPTATKYVRTAGREVTGTELVTNGTFDSDVSGFDKAGATSHTLSWNSGVAEMTRDASSPADQEFRQAIATKVGAFYRIEATHVGRVSGIGASRISVRNAAGSGLLVAGSYNTTSSAVTDVLFFQATDTTSYACLVMGGGTVAGVASFDNISVKEIDVDPSAARYLPRQGHHVYNGSQWVNKGLLHESEARTNLLTYSEDFSLNPPWQRSGGVNVTTSGTWFVNTTTGAGVYPKLVNSVSLGAGTYTFVYEVDTINSTGTYCDIGISGTGIGGSATSSYYTFTFATKAFSNRTNDVADDTWVEDLGNGVYRIGVTWTATTVTAAVIHILWNDGTSDVALYARRPQLEAGSTPSSYMPTYNGQFTRAAETLTIPAENLPWPSPVYVTNEELVNAANVASSWVPYGTNTITDGTDGVVITYVDQSSGAYLYLRAPHGLSLDLVNGSVYELTLDAKVTGGSANFRVYDGSAYILTQAIGGSEFTTYSFVFTKTTAGDPLINLSNFDAGDAVTFRNISVKEINPLAVSFQMSGEMTYADEGAVNNVWFFRWKLDSSNELRNRLQTDGIKTGQFSAYQAYEGTAEASASANEIYSPGVNIPFNIASRHLSNAVQGAADGITSTEQTDTAVGLPDLSSDDLELGFDFMGTIDTFRVWAEDIADTGIAEATEPSEEATLFLSFDGNQTSYISFDWSE